MFGRFRFLDPFPLRQDDLELVAPARQYVDSLLETLSDPLTVTLEPKSSRISRRQLLDFISAQSPFRRSLRQGRVPAYSFWMLLHLADRPPRVVGGLMLRISDTPDICNCIGHIGYNVYPPARGAHLAERACRMILPLARTHGINPLWITCNPDNIASRRTIERLGAELVEILPLPPNHPLRLEGETTKCRYRLTI